MQLSHLIGVLAKRTSRPFFVFAMGDHGENFGENGLWGHMHMSSESLEVPLWMFVVEP